MKSLYDALGVRDPEDKSQAESPEVFDELTAEGFSQAIVKSIQYRESIIRRILLDELPAPVECRILDHAIGKPIERIEVGSKLSPLHEQSAEELEQRALVLATRARLLRINQDDSPAAPSEESPGLPLIH